MKLLDLQCGRCGHVNVDVLLSEGEAAEVRTEKRLKSGNFPCEARCSNVDEYTVVLSVARPSKHSSWQVKP